MNSLLVELTGSVTTHNSRDWINLRLLWFKISLWDESLLFCIQPPTSSTWVVDNFFHLSANLHRLYRLQKNSSSVVAIHHHLMNFNCWACDDLVNFPYHHHLPILRFHLTRELEKAMNCAGERWCEALNGMRINRAMTNDDKLMLMTQMTSRIVKKNLNVWICASKGEKTVAAKCGTLLDTQTQPQPAQSEKKSLHQKW